MTDTLTPPTRNFVMAMGGAAAVVATLLYATSGSSKASESDLDNKVSSMSDKAKEQLRDVRLDELSGRSNKTPAERGLGAYRSE